MYEFLRLFLRRLAGRYAIAVFGAVVAVFISSSLPATPAAATSQAVPQGQSQIAQVPTMAPLLYVGGEADPGGGADDEDIVCIGGPLGYITCPLITMLTVAIKWVAEFLDVIFNFQALGNEAIRSSWGIFVNLANIMLAIGFLVIVMSQASSIGISNYGVKRMLPRVIAAAIFINLSFYISALAIDVSNVLGHNMMGFIGSLHQNASPPAGGGGGTSEPSAACEAAGGLMGAAGGGLFGLPGMVAGGFFGSKVGCSVDAITAGLSGGSIVVTILVAIGAIAIFIAFITTLALAIMRYVILIFLVLLAPLAFAAWVLPNTDQYFYKWWNMFLKLLMIYPAAMFMFGAAIFAADVIGSIGTINDGEFLTELFEDSSVSPEGVRAVWAVFQLFVVAMPLFFIPKLFKGIDGFIGNMNSRVAGVGGAVMGKYTGAVKSGSKVVGKKGLQYGKAGGIALGNKYGVKPGGSQLGRGFKRMRAYDKAVSNSLEARKAGKEAELQEQAAAAGLASASLTNMGGPRYKEGMYQKQDAAEQERVKAQQAQYGRSDLLNMDHMVNEMRQARTEGDNVKLQAAAGILASKFGSPGVNALHEEITNPDANWSKDQAKALTRATDAHYPGIAPKRADLAKGYFEEKDGAIQFTQGKLSAADPSTQLSNNVNAWVDAVKTGSAPDQKQAITLATGQKPADNAGVQHIIHEIASGRGDQLKIDIESGAFQKEVEVNGEKKIVFAPEKVPTATHGTWSPTPQSQRQAPPDAPSHNDFNDRNG